MAVEVEVQLRRGMYVQHPGAGYKVLEFGNEACSGCGGHWVALTLVRSDMGEGVVDCQKPLIPAFEGVLHEVHGVSRAEMNTLHATSV